MKLINNMRYRKLILGGILAYLLLFVQGAVASDDLAWAMPKPDLLRSDMSLRAGVVQKSLPESLSVRKPYIVGGATTTRGEYPEYSLLWVDGLDGYIYAICGASLVDDAKVLTAAHCTEGLVASRLYVIPAFHSFSSDATWGKVVGVAQKAEHPDYDQPVFANNDISILTLKKSARSAKVKVFGGKDQFAGETSTVIGVGLLSGGGTIPNTLQKVNLQIVSNSVCANAWGSSSITPGMLCAGGTSSGGVGACSGDSGGPFFINHDGERVQAGIVSWGHKDCAQPGFYDVYARISALISFIRQHAPGATIVVDPDVNIVPLLTPLLFDTD